VEAEAEKIARMSQGVKEVLALSIVDTEGFYVKRPFDDPEQRWSCGDVLSALLEVTGTYTLGGTGDVLITKAQYIAGLDNPQFELDSAIVDDLRIRVYGAAAVVTGRATYQGRYKKHGRYLRRFRFTDTFIRRDTIWKCVATHASALARE
jgi:Domain of unknown function (DUF4440)